MIGRRKNGTCKTEVIGTCLEKQQELERNAKHKDLIIKAQSFYDYYCPTSSDDTGPKPVDVFRILEDDEVKVVITTLPASGTLSAIIRGKEDKGTTSGSRQHSVSVTNGLKVIVNGNEVYFTEGHPCDIETLRIALTDIDLIQGVISRLGQANSQQELGRVCVDTEDVPMATQDAA